MQLETLSRFDEKTAKAVLAAAALTQSGAGYVSDSVHRYRDEVKDVLREAAARLDLKPGQSDYDKVMRSFLSDQVVKAIMGDTSTKEVISRMAAEGRLPVSSYDIVFSKDFKHNRESERYIKRIVSTAEDFQHVLAEAAPTPSLTKGMTLVVVPQWENGEIHHWILIDAIRMREKLHIDNVFRVFPQAVDLSNVETPLQMLRAFVRKYGVPFALEGSEQKAIHEQLSFNKSEDDLIVEAPKIDGQNVITKITGATFAYDFDDYQTCTTFVIAAYAINHSKYMKDRRLYGKH